MYINVPLYSEYHRKGDSEIDRTRERAIVDIKVFLIDLTGGRDDEINLHTL